MGTNTQSGPKHEVPSPQQICQELADRGDVLGLLDYLEDEANGSVLQSSMALLGRCIRERARTDVSRLTEDAFGRIIGLAVLLLARVQLYITARFKDCESSGAGMLSRFPADLVDEGWLDRAERLSRFIAEMASTRARIQHVTRLNDERRRIKLYPNWLEPSSPMDSDRIEAAPSKGSPGNGRVHSSSPSFRFP